MARKTRNHQLDLPPLELRCMRALWTAGTATVHEIRAGLLPDRPLAYTTVMTVMDRLARKGIVEREKRGRAHLYRPAIPEGTIRDHALKQLVDNFFRSSHENLQRHLNEGAATVGGTNSVDSAKVQEPKITKNFYDAETKHDAGIDTSLL